MPKTTRRPAKSTSTRPSSRKPASKPAGRPAARKTRPAARKQQPSLWSRISAERKLDLLGVLLALIGGLTLLALFSTNRSPVTGWWMQALTNLAGWGMFVLPLGLIAFGLWLVFRRVERFPALSAGRVAGVLLLYVNLLAWVHLFTGGGWGESMRGKGGWLGGMFEFFLEDRLGVAGAVIFLLAWTLIAMLVLFDLPLPELLQRIAALFKRKPGATPTVKEPALRHGLHPQPIDEPSSDLPEDFKPLEPLPVSSPNRGAAASPRSGPSPAASAAHALPVSVEQSAPEAGWVLPTLDSILDPATRLAVQAGADEQRARLIEETLASFGAPGRVVDIQRGPSVTQFGVEPDFVESRGGRVRVRVNKIQALADDLALALAASRIRIQAPVPGRRFVGIEVPNDEKVKVSLREVMESEKFAKIKSPLRFAIGKDVAGGSVSYDLASMPHLLIAGTTGSGKSVCVNSMLACLLLNNSPADLRLVLVDPKRVELTGYNGIPHLLAPVVVEPERVVGALQWMLREMDNRYHRFAATGTRNIVEFNGRYPEQKIPYLVMFIDELADLMMMAPEDTERSITRLAQLARATGIHLVLATQRPSVDVVTGLIKANFPARIAFAVFSSIDSRVILDQPGAERLLGRGDMLFQAPDAPAPARLQGVFVSDSEIQRLVEYWRLQSAQRPAAAPANDQGVDALPRGVPLKQTPLWDAMEEDGDPLYKEAVELVRREGRASITMLQRRLRVGYTRAARMIDTMEEKGVIAPSQPNSQVREVLDYGQTAPPEDDGA